MTDEPNSVPVVREWVQIDVRGNDPRLWATLKQRFLKKMSDLLEVTLDHNRGTTVRDEFKVFSSALLDYAKAKLATPGLEAEKIAAEIARTFAEEKTELASAEKVTEEARRVRIQNDVNELRVALGATRAMMIGDESQEAILFGKQIDSFLSTLKEIAESAR